MDTKQGKSAIDVINGLQDLPPAYYRMVVDALRDAVGCALCGGNDHNADECKRFAGERERFEAWYERTYGVRAFAQNVDHSYTEPTTEMIWAGWLARAAQPAPVVPEGLPSVLDEYERQTKQLPCQHEIRERGCSTYNWRMSVIRDLRAMLAAAPAQGQQVECQECEVLRDQRAAWIRQAAELGSALDAAQAELAALKALHSGEHGMPSDGWPTYHKRKMETLRDLITARYERQIAALKAQQAEQKPYAWALALPDGRVVLEKAYPHWIGGDTGGDGYSVTPLYTAPQPAPAQDVAEALRELIEFAEPTLQRLGFGYMGKVEKARRALAAHDKQSGGDV